MSYYMVLPFALVLITDKEGRVLIGKHPNSPKKPFPGFWDLPGGKMEKKESSEECAKREAFEELNLKLTNLAIFGVFHYNGSGALNGRIPSFAVCYLVLSYSGCLIPAEQEDVHFADRKELEDMWGTMTPWSQHFLKLFLSATGK